ncbi:helix-turn-helix domain-containing protein [Candidatus Sodalis pierantonius]|uniref:helix-turn-helix domain-containing protein n=1 Tax=Candidatus Sodalis pierantonii TaxID=1486991 RepID=UPI00130EC937
MDVKAGVKQDVVKSVLTRLCRKYELLVANALGVSPETIWPSRYEARNNSYIHKVS